MESAGHRFLIDASMAQIGGGYTYVVNLLPRLLRLSPADRFRILVRSERLALALPKQPNLEVTRLPPAGPIGRMRFLMGEAPHLAASWDADLYFSVSESVPLRLSCPSIASFRNPNTVDRKGHGWPLPQRLRLELLHAMSRLSASRCERILFVSEDSAQRMGAELGIPQNKRTVIYHGIDMTTWQQARPPISPERAYILSVSSIYRYKNFVRLIEAYRELLRRVPDAPDLVIIGEDRDPPYSRRMEAARQAAGAASARIRIIYGVPYAEVAGYYAGAALFVFPSYLETFGHPLLEAMASGVPLVAADTPVFREIAGDAAVYADPYRSRAIADAMERTLEDQALREQLVSRGQQRVREFSWNRSAERHLALFREVLEEVGASA